MGFSFFQNIKTCTTSTIFPAAYTAIGYKFDLLGSIHSWNWDREIRINPKELINFVISQIQSNSLETVKEGFSTVKEVFSKGLVQQIIYPAWKDHSIEIQTAAMWGFSASVLHLVLKKIPFLKEHTKTRALIATATTGVLLNSSYFLISGGKQDPFLYDIAANVILVGAAAKCINKLAQITLENIKYPPRFLVNSFRSTCNIGLYFFSLVDWPSCPEAPLKISSSKIQRKKSFGSKNFSTIKRRDSEEKAKELKNFIEEQSFNYLKDAEPLSDEEETLASIPTTKESDEKEKNTPINVTKESDEESSDIEEDKDPSPETQPSEVNKPLQEGYQSEDEPKAEKTESFFSRVLSLFNKT